MTYEEIEKYYNDLLNEGIITKKEHKNYISEIENVSDFDDYVLNKLDKNLPGSYSLSKKAGDWKSRLSKELKDVDLTKMTQSNLWEAMDVAGVDENLTDEATEYIKSLQAQREQKAKIEAEADAREQRRKELEDLPWYGKMLMSEASQRRYIDDPEHSSFYKEKRAAEKDQAPAWFPSSVLDFEKWEKGSLNPFSDKPFALGLKFTKRGSDEDVLTGTLSDRTDVGLGAAATTADIAGQFTPAMPAKFIGAGIRGVRDVKNKVLDDNINEKTWGEIGTGIGTDFALAGTTEFLSNFPQYARMFRAAGKEGKLAGATRHATESLVAKEAVKSLDEGLSLVPKNLSSMRHKEATEWVKTLPDSPFKSELMQITNKTTGFSAKDLQTKVDAWKSVQGGKFDFYGANDAARQALGNQSEGALLYSKMLGDMPELTTFEKGLAFGKENWGRGTSIGIRGSQAATRDEATPKSKYDKKEQLKRLGLE